MVPGDSENDSGETSGRDNSGAEDSPNAGGDDGNGTGPENSGNDPGDDEVEEETFPKSNVPPGVKVKLSFVGDILLASSVQQLMKDNGYDYPYAKALDYLTGTDLMAGNLENPITLRGTPAKDKQFVFKGTPDSLPALKNAGFDVVSLANNHTLDQGVEGLLDTMKYLDETGIPHVGGGNNDTEAFAPVILEAKGIKVAYIGVSRVLPVVEWKAGPNLPGVAESYDTTRTVEAIKKAKKQADIVVVMIHWGKEREDMPQQYQGEFGKLFIDSGADLIIGAHPHVLQGFEQYKGKWIVYSLGNFIFNMTKFTRSADTGVLDAECDVNGDCALRFNPMRAVKSQPTPLEGNEAAELFKRLTKISFGVKLDEEGNILPIN
ncbi:CapA family protein [Paenibacillaceae bacterium]|nr:CapA family protein [Paenibacillaceae bacterium]